MKSTVAYTDTFRVNDQQSRKRFREYIVRN